MPTVIANRIPIYYQIEGEGEPVLWIQGLGADHSAWLAQLNTFRRSYQCVVFDNRDVGRSAQVDAPYTLADMADDAAGLLAALGLPPAHVVGLSLGGGVAQELALRHPARVRSLTLVSSNARPDARLRELLGAWPDIYRKAGMVDFYRQGLPWLFSYRFFERPRAVPAFLHYAIDHPQPPEAFARQVAASLGHDTVDRLPLIRVPTLVVSGDEDILVPPRLSRTLAEGIPGASFAIIPEAGHAVNLEQTRVFNEIVQQFIEKQQGWTA